VSATSGCRPTEWTKGTPCLVSTGSGARDRQFKSSPRNQRTRDSFLDKPYSLKALPSSSILLPVSKAWQPSASTARPKPLRMDVFDWIDALTVVAHQKTPLFMSSQSFTCGVGSSSIGKVPFGSNEMIRVPVRIVFEIILMFSFCLPKVASRRNFGDDFPCPQP